MIPHDLNTPLYALTIGEFIELSKTIFEKKEPAKADYSAPHYVYGIAGLAGLLNCSLRTAQEIKSSGKIDKAISQQGRKIIIDSALAISLLKQKK